MRRRRIDYESNDVDLFSGATWPSVFLHDPAYALFRPLYDRTSPWRSSYDNLCVYLNAQARRLGGRRILMFHFKNLSLISNQFKILNTFLKDPFNFKQSLSNLFSDVDDFLRWRFDQFLDDPWQDFPVDEKTDMSSKVCDKDLISHTSALSDQKKKKLLKKALFKIPWQRQLEQSLEYESGVEGFHAYLIEKAIKECPDLLRQHSNEDIVNQIFSSPNSLLTLNLNGKDYIVFEAPVMIGAHYLSQKIQRRWFDGRGKRFYRILGSYARWDDAKIVLFRNESQKHQMFKDIKKDMLLVSVGEQKKAVADGVDYHLSLLVDSDLPDRSFMVSEWEINSQLTIIL